MSEPVPTGSRCAELPERIAKWEQTVRALQARLGQNASNSSLPPSSNPPHAPKPVVKKRTGKQTGGQPGHLGLSRLRLPPERGQHTIPLVPTHCERCPAPFSARPRPDGPAPPRHQAAGGPAPPPRPPHLSAP